MSGHETNAGSGNGSEVEVLTQLEGVTLGDRFTLTGRRLGSGGAGLVIEAEEDMGAGHRRRAAVKLLRDFSSGNAESVSRFQREADALRELSGHPHVVQVYGFGVDAHHGAWVAMELVERSLADELGPEPADPSLVRQVLEDAARGLTAMHEHEMQLLHLDVKPANLMRDKRGKFKLGDLGLARPAWASGTLWTSVKYAAPETFGPPDRADELTRQAYENLGPHTDLYSLGFVAYELALGQRLFRKQFPGVHPAFVETAGESVPSLRERNAWIAWQRSDEMPAPARQVLSEAFAEHEAFSEELSELIARLLAKDPRQRCQSAAEVLEALDAAPEPQWKPPPEPPKGPVLVWAAAIAVLALVVGLGLGLVIRPGADAAPVPPPPDRDVLAELAELVEVLEDAGIDELEGVGDVQELGAALAGRFQSIGRQRDQAVEARAQAETAARTAEEERDQAVARRQEAQRERDQAVQARTRAEAAARTAEEQRREAVARRQEAEREQDQAVARQQEAEGERRELNRQLDATEREKDRLETQVGQLARTLEALEGALRTAGVEVEDVGDAEAVAQALAGLAEFEGEFRVLSVPGQFETIQAAMDASRPGDVVRVEPGTYREYVEIADGVMLTSIVHASIVARARDASSLHRCLRKSPPPAWSGRVFRPGSRISSRHSPVECRPAHCWPSPRAR